MLCDGTSATRTLVVYKPETLQRALLGTLLQRFEMRALKLVAIKMVRPTLQIAQEHYAEHAKASFYHIACAHLASGPVVASVWGGRDVVSAVRAMVGGTEPLEAPVGTIRGDFGVHWRRNLIHASGTDAEAAREVALWFRPDEIVPWEQAHASWLYELPPELDRRDAPR